MNLKSQALLFCYGTFSMVLSMVISLRPLCAQQIPASGLYEISSGRYVECCGFAGPIPYTLPYAGQSFVQLLIERQTQLASMTFLQEDQQSVFSVFRCPPDAPIAFSFHNGVVSANTVTFVSNPGPVPRTDSWKYTVTYAESGLRIDGELEVDPGFCSDVPTHFSHTNVLAVLVRSGPTLEVLARDGDQVRFRFTGEPANDYFVEFTDRLPAQTWLVLTNFRAKLQPIEPLVTDYVTNGPARFYRVRQQDCQCD